MQYMLLIIGFHPDTTVDPSAAGSDEGPGVEAFMEYDQLISAAGVVVESHALEGVDIATTVQVRPDGERVVTDGPFAETREYLGGYYLIDVPDLDSAIEWAVRCPGARFGRIEVRPVANF